MGAVGDRVVCNRQIVDFVWMRGDLDQAPGRLVGYREVHCCCAVDGDSLGGHSQLIGSLQPPAGSPVIAGGDARTTFAIHRLLPHALKTHRAANARQFLPSLLFADLITTVIGRAPKSQCFIVYSATVVHTCGRRDSQHPF